MGFLLDVIWFRNHFLLARVYEGNVTQVVVRGLVRVRVGRKRQRDLTHWERCFGHISCNSDYMARLGWSIHPVAR